jgi:acetyl-CoA carboxylase biotin carboxyl carrier protein
VAASTTDSGNSDRQLTDLTAAVRELGQIMRDNGLHKIEIENGDLSLRLVATGGKVRQVAVAPVETLVSTETAEVEAAAEIGQVVTAPMVGTYYSSPAPGQPSFVQPGDRVHAGQTIGIIEAMKTMNEIPAGFAGVVGQIYVSNAQAVEYGTPLLSIVPDGARA